MEILRIFGWLSEVLYSPGEIVVHQDSHETATLAIAYGFG